MGKYKFFKIKTIKDWENEDWDVYDQRKSSSGLIVYKGWPYSLTPRDGIGGQFSYILTAEIVEFLKTHSITESEQKLGLSISIVAKFRRTIGIQNKFIYRNDQWLIEHQDELLHDSLETLKTKYGLKRSQVYQHKKWLAELIDLPIRKIMRKSQADDLQEQWYQKHKADMTQMSVIDISSQFNISPYLAKKAYNRIQEELGDLSFSEKFQQSKQDYLQWLTENQAVLLDKGKSIAELAAQFKKTEGQIRRARAKLREILKIPKLEDQNQTWLLANQEILLNPKLSKEETAIRLGIKPSQVYRKRGELKKLLKIPHHNDLVLAWRLDNQEILLSLHLTIPEIAKKLDRNKKYIIKNRMILRRFLGMTKQDQIISWVIDHQTDLETLNIEKFQKKYNIGRHVVKSYKKLLIQLKQNENDYSLSIVTHSVKVL